MKDWQYHLANAGIAGLLVTFGSLTPILTGNADFKAVAIGLCLGIVTGSIVFLNKMQEWVTTQDPCKPTNLKILNFL